MISVVTVATGCSTNNLGSVGLSSSLEDKRQTDGRTRTGPSHKPLLARARARIPKMDLEDWNQLAEDRVQ